VRNKHDHVYPSRPLSDDVPTIYLFALLGTPSYAAYHQKLRVLSDEGNIIYVLRHAPSPDVAISKVTYLRGFGVTLDLKSMEYKALDDQVLSDDDEEDNEDNQGEDGEEDAQSQVVSEEEDELNGMYFNTLVKRHPHLKSSLEELREKFENDQKEGSDGEMKVWDMKQLGLQATSRIVASKDPLKHLSEISSNFPMYAKRLVSVPVDKKIIRQVDNVRTRVQRARSSENVMLLNGKRVEASSDGFNLFELLTTILSEATTAARFQRLGLPNDVLRSILNVGTSGQAHSVGGGGVGELVGMRIDTRTQSKGCIYYLNNIEKDEHYKRWPKDLRSLLQPGFQLYPVRKNLYNGIFVIDPTKEQGVQALAALFKTHSKMIPLRIGLALVPDNIHSADSSNSDSSDTESNNGSDNDNDNDSNNDHGLVNSVIRLLVSAKKKHGIPSANQFLIELSKQKKFPMGLNHVLAAYAHGLKTASGSWSDSSFVTEAQEILKSDTAYVEVSDKIKKFVKSKGLPMYSYLINGKLHEGMAASLQQDLMQDVFREQQIIGQLVQVGVIKAKSNVYGYLTGTVTKKNKGKAKNVEFAFPKYDVRILDEKNVEYVPLVMPPSESSSSDGGTGESRDVLLNPTLQMRLPYLRSAIAVMKEQEEMEEQKQDTETDEENTVDQKKKKKKKKKKSTTTTKPLHHHVPMTHWVIADFCHPAGASLLRSAVEHYVNTKKIHDNTIRVALLHRGGLRCLRDVKGVSNEILDTIKGSPMEDIQRSLASILPLDVLRGADALPCLVTNGRLIRVGERTTFDATSFALLEKFERSRFTSKIQKVLKKAGRNQDYEVVMRANSLVAQHAAQKREEPAIKPSKALQYFDAVSFVHHGRKDMEVVAIIDPLSISAQRMAPTLLMLRDVFNMTLTVFLHPNTDIQSFPLKNFYRFVPTTVITQQQQQALQEQKMIMNKKKSKTERVIKPKDIKETTDPDRILAASSGATKTMPAATNQLEWGSKERATTKFRRLPKQHVLTLKLVTPESWVAMKYKVDDDLDNIRLDDATMGARKTVHAEFRLTSLLVSGNCNDLTHYKPPNGLQLVLKDATDLTNERVVTDTLVMQNLGYFQLKTQPGSFRISLAKGRASTLYAIAPEGTSLYCCCCIAIAFCSVVAALLVCCFFVIIF